jgi:ribosome-binding ATPase
MKIGIIGLEQSGKTTIFNTLTGQSAEVGYGGSKKHNLGIIKVPDERVDYLSEIYQPKKTTYAEISFVDVAVDEPGKHEEKGFSAKLIGEIKTMDAFAIVIRAFKNPNVPHPNNKIDPMSDLKEVELEMIFSDLSLVENRLDRASKDKKLMKDKQAYEKEINLMSKLRDQLSEEKMIKDLDLSDEERKEIVHYQFLTDKSYLVLINTGEDGDETVDISEVIDYMKTEGITYVDLCGKIEMELSQLPEDEQKEFMGELGISEPARNRFIKESYAMLDLISFLTSGKDECRAWTIKRGTTSKKAAGKIHSDLERGFIRAEVMSFHAFKNHGGNVTKVKEDGQLRLEGKDYIVQDGDILNIKFNV